MPEQTAILLSGIPFNLVYLLCNIIGVSLHILMKYNSLKKDAQGAGMKLSFGRFVSDDWPSMLIALLPGFVWMLTFGEVAKKYEAIAAYAGFSFFLVGLCGSYGVLYVRSATKRWIREATGDKVADCAPEEADKKTGGDL